MSDMAENEIDYLENKQWLNDQCKRIDKKRKIQLKYLTYMQANEVENFMIEKANNILKSYTLKDYGSCIIGNCLQALVLMPNKRKPSKACLLYNSWTQGEQREFLQTILKATKEKYPQYSHLLFYNCGNMD